MKSIVFDGDMPSNFLSDEISFNVGISKNSQLRSDDKNG
jgi:hypothetical protein